MVMEEDLNDILKECAYMRGVSNLMHRILLDFSNFVETIVYKGWETKPHLECFKKYRPDDENGHELEEGGIFNFNDPDALVEWAKLFREYYREQAIEWRESEREAMREMLRESCKDVDDDTTFEQ